MDTVPAVIVTDASKVNIDSVADNLLEFSHPKELSGSSLSSSSDTSSRAIAFDGLLYESPLPILLTFLVLLVSKFSPDQICYSYAFARHKSSTGIQNLTTSSRSFLDRVIQLAMEGSKEQEGAVFKAVVDCRPSGVHKQVHFIRHHCSHNPIKCGTATTSTSWNCRVGS